jgi:hypothetical protein
MDALLKLFRCADFVTLEHRLILGSLIKELAQRNISGVAGLNLKSAVAQYDQLAEDEELKHSSNIDEEATKQISHEERVLCGLKLFCKAIPQQVDMDKELCKLAMVLESDLQQVCRFVVIAVVVRLVVVAACLKAHTLTCVIAIVYTQTHHSS